MAILNIVASETTYKPLKTIIHTVNAAEAGSGIVRLQIANSITSGTGLAYDYWTRTSAGLGRVTAYNSNFIQASGVLFISGTFTTGDILTSRIQFI
jgi:hypothetical protein